MDQQQNKSNKKDEAKKRVAVLVSPFYTKPPVRLSISTHLFHHFSRWFVVIFLDLSIIFVVFLVIPLILAYIEEN